MKKLATIAALALLAFAPAAAVLAQEIAAEEMEAVETTLTGQLSGSEETGYVLTEEASGDEVQLEGVDVDFAAHVDTTVSVTGQWANDADGNRYFEVSKVEAATPETPSEG